MSGRPGPIWSFVAGGRGPEPTGPPALPEARQAWLLEHDPLWLSAVLDDPSKAVLLAVKDGGCFCGLFVHDVGLTLDLGHLSLARVPVRRHVLIGGLPEKAVGPADLVALLTDLSAELPARGVVFLQGVHENEALRAAVEDPVVRRAYHVRRHGPSYRRCRIALTGSYDGYLASLGRSTRKDLRRLVRHFNEAFEGSAEAQVITRPEDVEAALPDLFALSAKTYAGRVLGLGISPGNVLERQLRHGAKLGMTRLDLLRVGGRAISFQIAYIHRHTLYATQAGYDPEWREWSPGIVHHAFILQHLCRTSPEIRFFDFMYGEEPYKARLSNAFHRESHFYLFPRTARGGLTWVALEASDRLSRCVTAILNRTGGKAALMKLIYRLAGWRRR